MLVDRLTVVEDALSQNTYDNLLRSLIKCKVRLAEADYAAAEIRGLLHRERDKSRRVSAALARFNVSCDDLLSGKVVLKARPNNFGGWGPRHHLLS